MNRKIMLFFIICISSFGFWLTSENQIGLDSLEKEIGLFNFNGDGSWISVNKVDEFVPIFSENGKQIFTGPQNSYYDISFGFEDYLAGRSINNLKTVKITNDKNETLKEFRVKVLPNSLYMQPLDEKETEKFIMFLAKSNSLTLFFRDDNGKIAVQKFNVEGFIDSVPSIVPRKESVKSSFPLETEILPSEKIPEK